MPAGYLSREVALRSALATRGEKSGGQQARFAGDYRSWVRSSRARRWPGSKTYAAMSGPSVLDPVTGLLAETARGGPPLEFAVGTGRVALPLSTRGIAVHGLELLPHMAERLLAKPGAGAVPVT